MQVKKPVRFYATIIDVAAQDGQPATEDEAGPDFWAAVMEKIGLLSNPADRRSRVGAREYFGNVVLPSSPAVRHLQIGRLRDISEHIEETDLDSGTVEPLILAGNKRVSEPTFVVPVTGTSRVAVVSPGRSTSYQAIGRWLTAVLDLAPQGKSVRLAPILDPNALEKLLAAQGAVGFEFFIDAQQDLSEGTDLPMIAAIDELKDVGPSTGTMYVGWSLGREGGSISERNQIKAAAARFATKRLAKRASANLIVEDEEGTLRREVHELFADEIVTQAVWHVDANKRLTTETIISEVMDAIKATSLPASLDVG